MIKITLFINPFNDICVGFIKNHQLKKVVYGIEKNNK